MCVPGVTVGLSLMEESHLDSVEQSTLVYSWLPILTLCPNYIMCCGLTPCCRVQ